MDDPKKIPQWRNDLNAVLRVAMEPREYEFTPRDIDDRFTLKQLTQFNRVAQRVGLFINLGSSFATLREEGERRTAPPVVHTNRPRVLAAKLLELYAERGGQQC